jgi:hypothetical protein
MMEGIYGVIISGSVVAILSVSMTFFLTTLSKNKTIANEVRAGVKTHKAIDHQKNIDTEIEKHEGDCLARKDYFTVQKQMIHVKTALCFLVKEAKGNPEELGLTDDS